MFTFNKANRNAITSIFVLLAIIVALTATRSTYQPRPIVIKAISEESLFNLEHKIECAAGTPVGESPYSKSLTPGGVCGAQKLVDDQAGYAIEDGVGGSLI